MIWLAIASACALSIALLEQMKRPLHVRSLILTFRQKSVWTVSKDGSVAIWEQVPAITADHFVEFCFTILVDRFVDFDFLIVFLFSPARSKSSALPPLKESSKQEWER
jgi:hypothetical protein